MSNEQNTTNESIPATPLQPAIPNMPIPPFPGPHPKPIEPYFRRRRLFTDCFDPNDWYPVPVPPRGPIPPQGYNIKPLERYAPGLNTEQQIQYLYNNMNQLIEIFNQCNEKVFGAYQAVVESATCNDAYYREITTEEGYLSESQTAYKVTHIPFIDKTGNPIYIELGLPNNSKVNDGATENCYSCSKRTLADKLIPATQSGEQWKGYTIYKGAQISAPVHGVREEDKWYTFGISDNGYLKWYPSDVTIRTLNVERIRNAMNCSAVLVNSGKVSPELFSPVGNQRLARTAIGMNYQTKERFIIVVDGTEQSGCTEEELANIFIQYGCTVAVQTAYSTSAFGMNKGLMMFEPSTVDSDQTPTMPAVSGFWYITKRRHYHNAFVKEIAYLTQLMGEQIWYDWLNADSIDYVKDRIREVVEQIKQEINDREEADTNLQNQIDGIRGFDVAEVLEDTDGADKVIYTIKLKNGSLLTSSIITYNYENLKQKLASYATLEQTLQTEIATRQSEDDKLLAAINQEKSERIAKDSELEAMFSDPNSAIMKLIREIETNLQGNINAETIARQTEDTALRNLITAEETARISGDQNLQSSINTVISEYTAFKNSATTDITNLKTSVQALENQLQSDISTLTSQVTNITGDVQVLQGQYNELVTRLAAMNSAITSLQSAFQDMETSFDQIKDNFNRVLQQFESLKQTVDGILPDVKEKIENGLWLSMITIGDTDGITTRIRPDANGAYISKPGDNGEDTLAELKVAEPTTDKSATNKEYVDKGIKTALENADFDQYVKKTGDEMTGNLLFKSDAGINFKVNQSDEFVGLRGYDDGNSKVFNIYTETAGTTSVLRGLSDPVGYSDGVPKGYIDNNVKEQIESGPWLSMLSIGSADGSLTTRFRPDINGAFISKPGSDGQDTLGELKVADPTTGKSAINKEYLETAIAEGLADNHNYVDTHALLLSGGAMKGNINMSGNGVTNLPAPTENSDAVTKEYVDNLIETGTIKGLLEFEEEQLVELNLNETFTATKSGIVVLSTKTSTAEFTDQVLEYKHGNAVIREVPLSASHDSDWGGGNTATLPVNEGDTLKLIRSSSSGLALFFYPFKGVPILEPTLDNVLSLDGGTMKGTINMGGNSVTNLPEPVENNDAATKEYVDNLVNAEGIQGLLEFEEEEIISLSINSTFTATRSGILQMYTRAGEAQYVDALVAYKHGSANARNVAVSAVNHEDWGSGNGTTLPMNAGDTVTLLKHNATSLNFVFYPFKKIPALKPNISQELVFGQEIEVTHTSVTVPYSLVVEHPCLVQVDVRDALIRCNYRIVGTNNTVGEYASLTYPLNKGDTFLIDTYNKSTASGSSPAFWIDIIPIMPFDVYGDINALPLTGGTMDGAIDMGNHLITNLLYSTEDNNASTVGYVKERVNSLEKHFYYTYATGEGTSYNFTLNTPGFSIINFTHSGGSAYATFVLSSDRVITIVNQGNLFNVTSINSSTFTVTCNAAAYHIGIISTSRITLKS